MNQSDYFKRVDSLNSLDSEGRDIFIKKLILNAQQNWSAIMNNPNHDQSQYQSHNQDDYQLDSQYNSHNSQTNQIRTKAFTFSNQKNSEPNNNLSYLSEISQLKYTKQVYEQQIYGVFYALRLIFQIQNDDDYLRTLDNLQFSKYQIPSDVPIYSKIYLWDPRKVVSLVKQGKMLKSVLVRQIQIQENKFIQTGKEKKEIHIEFNSILIENKNEINKNSPLWITSKEQQDYRLLLNSNSRCFAIYFQSYEDSNRAKDYIIIKHKVKKSSKVLAKIQKTFSLKKRTFFSIFFKIQLEQYLKYKQQSNLEQQSINQRPLFGTQPFFNTQSSNYRNQIDQRNLEKQIIKVANEYLNFLYEDARQIEEMTYDDILTRQGLRHIKLQEQYSEEESYDFSQQNIQEADEEDEYDDQQKLSNFQSSSIGVDDDEEMPKINLHDTNFTSKKQHHAMFIRQRDLLYKKIKNH